MKAVYITEAGGTDRLIYGDVPEPESNADQVLVRVRACALNRLDIFTREGSHGIRPFSGQIPGLDLAGEVVQVGSRVTKFRVGVRVMGIGDGGTYAEYSVARPDSLELMPQGLSFEQGAAVPTVFCAAWHCLVCRANIKIGETALILAAGSGVGSAGIQIAKAAGAYVITTASNEEKCLKAKELGADEVINHTREDIAQRVKDLTGGQGVDLVYDHVGQATWEKSFASLKEGGRYVTNGVTSGHMAQIHLGRLWTRDLTVMGTHMRVPPDEIATVTRLVGSGLLHPVIDRVLPLKDASQAHTILESGSFFGKIVLRVP